VDKLGPAVFPAHQAVGLKNEIRYKKKKIFISKKFLFFT